MAMIGDEETLLPFLTLGLELYPASDDKEAERIFARITRSREFGVIFVTERLYPALKKEIDRIAYEPLPAVVLIPDISGSRGFGLANIRATVKKAAGRDIIGEAKEE